MRRAFLVTSVVLVLLPVLAAVAVEIVARVSPMPSLQRFADVSQMVTDRDKHLLRAYLTRDQKWRLPVTTSEMPKSYLDLLVGYEDRKFWTHHGVDVAALFRAFLQMLSSAKVVSGGSTLTMQVARLLNPAPRDLKAKILQIIAARQLERKFSKDKILAIYLTLAPFGGNIEGVRAASMMYFGKEPKQLTLSEAALLIALPQAPEARRPDLWPKKTFAARKRVIDRAVRAGVLTSESATSLNNQPMNAVRRPMMVSAPHLADFVRRRQPNSPIIQTTIDGELQASIENLVGGAVQVEKTRVSVAVIVVRNSDFSVLGYLSGPNFFSETKAGQVDLVTAVRSPGSALKPFIYGLAFEKLIVHPMTTTLDAPVRFGNYAPKNFGQDYQGEVTVRDALIRSINTTAVSILARIGPERFISRLRSVGADLRIDDVDRDAGLSVALGGCGISLADLARLYGGLASGGVRNLRFTAQHRTTPALPLLTPEASWAVTDILADAIPPVGFSYRQSLAGGRRFGYKTGTSYSFRDAWAVGYDREVTVAVWVGRPDGASNPGGVGRETAAPILFQIFDLIPPPWEDVAGMPPGDSVLARRDQLPERLIRFNSDAPYSSETALRLAFPPDGAKIEAGNAADAPAITLQALGGRPPYFWYVNKSPVLTESGSINPRWQPSEKGQYHLKVLDQNGVSVAADVWIE